MGIKHIAVVLESADQAALIAPYLREATHAGTVIKFVLRVRASRSDWIQAGITALAMDNADAFKSWEQQYQLALNEQQLAAERTLGELRASLLEHGATTELWFYTGSLRNALAEMRESCGGSLLIVRPKKPSFLTSFFRALLTKVGLRSRRTVAELSLAFQCPA